VVTPPDSPSLPGARAECWKLRTETLRFGRRPLVMGILNVTPDSFSDGGRYFEPAAAVEYGLRLVAEGADILDVGGESTRPGSPAVDPDEELRRVMPVVEALCRQTKAPLSIDTRKAAVAREAIAAGAQIINDVSALTADPAMLDVAVASGAGVCLMHMRGKPETMQDNPVYEDVVGEVFAYLRSRRDVLIAAGVEVQRIAVDPGIGFGKTVAHNLALLSQARRLHALGTAVLIGPSRKRFIRQALGADHLDVVAGTIGVAAALARQGVQVLRVHDVAAVRQAIVLFEAAGGLE
jgi:dihydropteroate synthase